MIDAYDLEAAEKGLISCILQDPELAATARKRLPSGRDFTYPPFAKLYDTVLAMVDANKPVDFISVTEHIRDQGIHELDKIGGPSLISDVFIFVPVTSHFDYYVAKVWERAKLKQLKTKLATIGQEVDSYGQGDEGENITAFFNRAEAEMFTLVQEVGSQQSSGTGLRTTRQSIRDWLQHMHRVIANRGRVLGLTTGIHEIDMTLHGIDDSEGEILVIAGRPGQGKTAMGVSIESHFIEQEYPGLVISAEMSENQYNTRLVLGGCPIDTSKGFTGHFTEEEEQLMAQRATKLAEAKRLICADSYITAADIRTHAQVAKRKYGIRWMLVDHLTLIKPVTAQGIKDERIGIKEVMETLQWCKKELKLGIILLVQMNRDADKSAGKPPVMSDLAGSATIEQLADHICFLYRPSYYYPWYRLPDTHKEAWIREVKPRRERSPQTWSESTEYSDEEGGFYRQDYEEDALLFFRKNRRGPTPDVHCRFRDKYTWYSPRMPVLNSQHPLDQQFKHYAIGGGAGPAPSAESETIKPRATKGTKPTPTHRKPSESLDDIFPES
jgi:replicative DNA helicase